MTDEPVMGHEDFAGERVGPRGRAERLRPPGFERTLQRMRAAIQAVNDGGSTETNYVSACALVAHGMVDEVVGAVALRDARANQAMHTALRDVLAERLRQETLWPDQTCAEGRLPHAVKLAILLEEVGEVAHELTEGLNTMPRGTRDADPVKLRTELIQVAAVAVAWAESITTPGVGVAPA